VLVRIDPKNDKPAGQVTVGAEPTGVAVGSGQVWVTTLGDSRIWEVDAGSLRSSKIPAQGFPIGVAVRNGSAYVADSLGGPYGGGSTGEGQVAVVAAGDSAATVSIPTHGATAVVNGPDGLWVANDRGVSRLAIVSNIAGGTSEHVNLPSFFATHLALAEGSGSVWVLDDAVSRSLWRIDPIRRRIKKITLSFSPAAVAAGFGGVWVTEQLDDEVVRIDPATNRIVATVKVGREPLGVAVGAGAVWVANTIARTVTKIDPATNRPVATIPVKSSPTSIAVGDGYVWVAADAR